MYERRRAGISFIVSSSEIICVYFSIFCAAHLIPFVVCVCVCVCVCACVCVCVCAYNVTPTPNPLAQ